jgi:hypothetical protein
MGQDEAAVPLALSAAERTRRTAPVTPQGVLKAAAEVGYVPNMERIAPFLKAMGADATDADGGPVQAPVEGELAGGGRWYGFPGTKIRGVREGMPSGATEIPGLPGFRQFGSRAVPLRTEHTGALRPVLDPVNGQAIPGFGMDAEGRVHDFRTQIQKAVGEERGGGALELPRGKDGKIDAGKLKKGQSYNSAKGVVTWDGSKFVGQ